MNLYTDGAQSSKTKKGGWAVVSDSHEQNPSYPYLVAYGSEEVTTNNKMELHAVIAALKYIFENDALPDHIIYTDSAYVANCIKDRWYVRWRLNGWKNADKDPVKNKELWQELLQYYELLNVEILRIKAHADNKFNNLADKYAVMAREGKIK